LQNNYSPSLLCYSSRLNFNNLKVTMDVHPRHLAFN